MVFIKLQIEPLDVANLYKKLKSPTYGAICVFTGTVREWTDDEHTETIEYTAYEEMAVKELEKLAEPMEANGDRVVIAHRLGVLQICDEAVFVGVASPHRAQAFEEAQFLMNEIKKRVPIWKKEVDNKGEVERWGK